MEYGKNYEGYWTGELFVKQVLISLISGTLLTSRVSTVEGKKNPSLRKDPWPRISDATYG